MRFLQDKHGGDPQAEIDFSVNISPLGMSGTVFDACVSALRRADQHAAAIAHGQAGTLDIGGARNGHRPS